MAKVTVNSSDPSLERYYIVTVKSQLYATSTFTPEFKFKIYLHVSPCLRSVLSWGTIVPLNIAYQIRNGAVNTQNHFD